MNISNRNEKEAGIGYIKERIAEFEKWKSELNENNKKLQEKYDRMNATLQTFMNIWSMESNQQYLQVAVKDFKDITSWFGDIGKVIENGLSKYQEKLQELIDDRKSLPKRKRRSRIMKNDTCECYGTGIGEESSCVYCGMPVITVLGEGDINKKEAKKYRNSLVSRITDIFVKAFTYTVKDNKFLDKGKRTIPIANGKECFKRLKWAGQDFRQAPGQGKRQLTIRYQFYRKSPEAFL